MSDVAAPAGSVIGYLDRCRRPAGDGRHGAKEWHHVVIHHDGLHLLVNLSESRPAVGDAVATRVICMARHQCWESAVVDVATATGEDTPHLDASYGDSRIRWDGTRYHLRVDTGGHGMELDVTLEPEARPSLLTGVPLSVSERLSWFFVPRLSTRGHARIGGRSWDLDGAVAYHDHNWGRFDWGGDFAWEWASGIGEGWSVTCSQLLDGRRHRLRSTFLHLEGHGERATFRDAEVRVDTVGRMSMTGAPIVPGAMRFITPDVTEDVPERMFWSARRGRDAIDAEIVPVEVIRLAVPSETDLTGVVVLAEAVGTVEVEGVVGGRAVRGRGRSILELLR